IPAQVLPVCSQKQVNLMGPRNTKNTFSSNGFTLFEILIAIFIFAVVLTTIYTSYTGTFRVVEEAGSQAETYGMARIGAERMLEDLESLYIEKREENPRLGKDTTSTFRFVGEDREIKGRSADSLRFISRAHINLSGQERDPGATEIAYYVQENEGEDTLVLYRSDRPVFDKAASIDEESGGLILCERLISVNFTYYDERGEAHGSWNTVSGEHKHAIPKMVSISLEFADSLDPEAPLAFSTSVALPVGEKSL
ncbi:MAG: type II secretion system protein GspJ, partial [Pseudomonadota bacterium]